MSWNESIAPVFAVLAKDFLSEWRTRYAISTIFLFILTTVTIIIIGTASEELTGGIKSGLLWIVMFFGEMTGLSKSFVSEEERGTGLFLRTAVSSTAVYFGKLCFNIALSFVLNLFAVGIFSLFVGLPYSTSISCFGVSVLLGSLGLGTASTIISAIIAKANSKNAVFPVLSFPLLLPLIYCGIESTRLAFDGDFFSESADLLTAMLCYSGAVASFAFILFHYVWND
jgi:heme exporter protein B